MLKALGSSTPPVSADRAMATPVRARRASRSELATPVKAAKPALQGIPEAKEETLEAHGFLRSVFRGCGSLSGGRAWVWILYSWRLPTTNRNGLGD